MPARQGAPDENQADIIGAYLALGCSVVDAHAIGGGFPDLVVGVAAPYGRVTELVEVKTATGRLEQSQERFIRDWRGSPVVVVRSREDAAAHVQSVRRRKYGGSQ